MLNKLIRFFLENRLITVLLLALFVAWGIVTAPFNWNIDFLPRDPVPVDAIPDIGENQQIVFTEWMGRSPQDVEDQITYPLTTALLGLPGVTSVRSTSMFGLSFIAIIFNENVEYYWSRTRVLEKLNSLSSDILPQGVSPALGPDATGLGQVYWYTLEGRDENGRPAGGWDTHELRSIQDFYVKYGLTASEGVSEVASIGGFVKEYQVDLDPVAMKAHDVSMMMVMEAIRSSNLDIGVNTVEMNLVEYYVRGLGYVKRLQDLEQAVVKVTDNIPIRIRDIAKVNIGPASRGHSGFLDKGGAEAVGGVVIARYGDNPLKVIQNVKDKINEISPGLPSKTLEEGTVSKVTIVPFYDRTELIYETLGTLNEAISLQILITIIVIIIMVFHLRASLMISALLPLAVLMCFIMMKYLKVDANIVALSGIAIAIGTMVDLGIILMENILRHNEEAPPGQPLIETVYNASTEVASAILTAVSTTIVSFLPVFTLQAAEGKLFGPLAYTKSFALAAALVITLFMMPAFAYWMFSLKTIRNLYRAALNILLTISGIIVLWWSIWAGFVLFILGVNNILGNLAVEQKLPSENLNTFINNYHNTVTIAIVTIAVSLLLAVEWMPLGVANSLLLNFLFIALIIVVVLGGFKLFIRGYPVILNWCLGHKKIFLFLPLLIILFGVNIWLGFDRVFSVITKMTDKRGWNIRTTPVWSSLSHTFPGIEKEFMPALNEGSFLLMPTSMPHSGVEANIKYVQQLDMRVQAIPEVEMVVGKAGRAETAIDPAPISMFENIILYKTEYINDENGYPIRFKVDKHRKFIKDNKGELIPDNKGLYFRQWRDHIKTPDDIWNEIVNATDDIPGVTSAPKLQPIETRLVMLQTGMRAPMGLKVFGPDLKSIEGFSLEIEQLLKEVPSVKPEAVYADRSLGKPYLEIDINRTAIARYGLNIADVQMYLEVALGGMPLTTTVEGRERYNIRARYAREWRDNPEAMKRVLIPAPTGQQIPLGDLAAIEYRPGAMMIRGENTFLVGYVLLDKQDGFSEVTVVEHADNFLKAKIASGELKVPPGVSYKFSGSYENQVRAEKRLAIVVPLVLAAIFLILYFQFRSTSTSLMIFSAITLAFSGGFVMLWLYSESWFMDFSMFGINIRELFQMKTYNLSVAVWVGFIALFGIATDDGVVISTYLMQSFKKYKPENIFEIRKAVLEAGMKRVRPCLMTTATTLLALLPILTSSGRGADIMIPMAIPAFGGMAVALITLFVVPVLYASREEYLTKRDIR
ncbi:MAG: efflux RND transporter permease subunit [Desulfatiglans sp.]|jgi:Cu(I)/Ag(I) efflux system membrane protein CusA/SilA|nr:efflux RND transporter permease subunit [Desulfatiglans sp.]